MHTEKKGKTPIVILFFTLMAYNTDNHRIVMTTVGLRWSPASCRKVSYTYDHFSIAARDDATAEIPV